MKTINQRVKVEDFPLIKSGKDVFLGYIVAVGCFLDTKRDWKDEDNFIYADFFYSGEYTRYRLPNNEKLVNQLQKGVSDNIRELDGTHYASCSTKVYVERLDDGTLNVFPS